MHSVHDNHGVFEKHSVVRHGVPDYGYSLFSHAAGATVQSGPEGMLAVAASADVFQNRVQVGLEELFLGVDALAVDENAHTLLEIDHLWRYPDADLSGSCADVDIVIGYSCP